MMYALVRYVYDMQRANERQAVAWENFSCGIC